MRSFTCLLLCLAALSIRAQWIQTSGPEGGNTSLVAVDDTLFAGSGDGLYRSTNDGDSWQLIAFHHQNVFLHPRVRNLLFVTMLQDRSLYRSEDNGRTWKQAASLHTAQELMSISNFGDTLFTFGADYPMPYFILQGDTVIFYSFYSTDKGDSWSKDAVAAILTNSSPVLTQPWFQRRLININGELYSYNGLMFKRQDGRWKQSSLFKGVRSITAVGSKLFAASDTLFYSEDGGNTWNKQTSFEPYALTSLAGKIIANHFPVNQSENYFPSELSVSIDTGKTWQHIQQERPFPGTKVLSMAITAKGYFISTNLGIASILFGDTVSIYSNRGLIGTSIQYLKTINNSLFAYSKPFIYKSENGIDWEEFYSPIDLSNRFHFPIANLNGVYVLLIPDGFYKGRLIKSLDRGVTWQVIETPIQGDSIVNVAATNSRIYALAYKDNIYFSDDTGRSWQLIPTRLEGRNEGIFVKDSLLMVRISHNWGEVFSSWDGGINWTETGAVDPIAESDGIILGAYRNNIIRSSDLGHSWDTVFRGSTNQIFYSIAFNGANAIVSGNNSIYSHDKGNTWDTLRSLPVHGSNQLLPVVVAAFQNHFYASRESMGVWRVPFELVKVSDKVRRSSDLVVFPNPALRYIDVYFTIDDPTNVRVAIYDALGRMQFNRSSNYDVGDFTERISLNFLSPGVYWIDFRSAGKTSLKKFSLVK